MATQGDRFNTNCSISVVIGRRRNEKGYTRNMEFWKRLFSGPPNALLGFRSLFIPKFNTAAECSIYFSSCSTGAYQLEQLLPDKILQFAENRHLFTTLVGYLDINAWFTGFSEFLSTVLSSANSTPSKSSAPSSPRGDGWIENWCDFISGIGFSINQYFLTSHSLPFLRKPWLQRFDCFSIYFTLRSYNTSLHRKNENLLSWITSLLCCPAGRWQWNRV